jgi:Fe-S cluster assembly protein SufD
MTTSNDNGLLADHTALAAGLPGAGAGWIDALRADGAKRFAGLGLPTRKVEEWKYTDLSALARSRFAPCCGAAPAHAKPEIPAPLVKDGPQAVFVNGRFDPELSSLGGAPEGITALPLAEAIAQMPKLLESYMGRVAELGRKSLVALNTAWLADGFVLHLAKDVRLTRPLELVFWGDSGSDGERSAWHPRHLIVLDPGASATLLERHIGRTGGHFANSVTEIAAATGASLRHYRLQDEPGDAVHIATTEVALSAGASYESFVLSKGAVLARNQIAVTLQGEGASASVNGAYMGRGSQITDTTTLIDHAAPGCTSSQTYKGVLDDRSRGVFQGRIVVRKDAQKSDGHQSNKAILLSDRAEIDAKPELEIYADDVKCSHGATAGELDDNALFYLRARGIPEHEARGLLIDAFIDGAIGTITHETVRDAFRDHAEAWRQEGGT